MDASEVYSKHFSSTGFPWASCMFEGLVSLGSISIFAATTAKEYQAGQSTTICHSLHGSHSSSSSSWFSYLVSNHQSAHPQKTDYQGKVENRWWENCRSIHGTCVDCTTRTANLARRWHLATTVWSATRGSHGSTGHRTGYNDPSPQQVSSRSLPSSHYLEECSQRIGCLDSPIVDTMVVLCGSIYPARMAECLPLLSAEAR